MSHGQEIRRWERCERGGVLVFASHRSQTFGGWMFLALQSLDIIVTAGVPFHSEFSSLVGTGCRLTQYQAHASASRRRCNICSYCRRTDKDAVTCWLCGGHVGEDLDTRLTSGLRHTDISPADAIDLQPFVPSLYQAFLSRCLHVRSEVC